jgi:hypothetical protein
MVNEEREQQQLDQEQPAAESGEGPPRQKGKVNHSLQLHWTRGTLDIVAIPPGGILLAPVAVDWRQPCCLVISRTEWAFAAAA